MAKDDFWHNFTNQQLSNDRNYTKLVIERIDLSRNINRVKDNNYGEFT